MASETYVELTPAGYMEAYWAIGTLRSRIFDDELRELADQVRHAAWAIISAQDEEAVWERSRQATGLTDLLNKRVTVLLKELS